MTIREETQAIERQTLSRYATLSQSTRGRRRPEDEDPIRPCYQRDRDRIIHCKAFRRLKQKTQVFLSPEGGVRSCFCPCEMFVASSLISILYPSANVFIK